MINCFRNGCLDLYIEYNNYIRSLSVKRKDSDHYGTDVINLIKQNVEKINFVIKLLLRKMLTYSSVNLQSNPSHELPYKSEEIYEILELDSYTREIFSFDHDASSKYNLEIDTPPVVKRVIVILFGISLFFENLSLFKYNREVTAADRLNNKNSLMRFFSYSKEKVLSFSEICAEDNITLERCAKKYLLEKFILPIVKEKYFDPILITSGSIDTKLNSYHEYIEKRKTLEIFLKELKLDLFEENQNSFSHYLNSLSAIKEIIIENFFSNFENFLFFNLNSLKRYLAKIKDFRKLFSSDNQLRNELIYILHSNFSEIINEISYHNFNSIKEKSRLLKIIDKNISLIINTIQDFFMDDFYLIKLSGQDSTGNISHLNNFKLQLLDLENEKGIIIEFMRNIYESQGLKKYWEKSLTSSKKEEWKNFLSVTYD